MAAGAIIGGVFNMLSSMYNNRAAAEREELARRRNYLFGEWQAENADRRARQLYTDLHSPAAQLEQIKTAGLSPSVFFESGAGGGGITQGAQGASAGVQPTYYPMSALEAAQIGLLEAQTQKTQAEAETEQGTNERGQNEIQNIIAQTENYKAMSNYAQSQNELIQLTKESTLSQAVSNAKIAANKAQQSYNEMLQSGIEFEISEATKDARIEKQKESVKLIISQRLKNQSDIKLQEKEIEEISARISLMYDEAMRGWAMTDAMLQNAETFEKEIEQKQKQFEMSLDLELDKWGFDKEHWLKNKMIDLSGDLIHAGGYIIGLSMMKGGKQQVGNVKLTKQKGTFEYGKFNPNFNGTINGVKYNNGLPIVPQITIM